MLGSHMPLCHAGIIPLVTATEEIKARIDAAELIGETVKLRRSGKNYTGFCPFHQNVNTPSFAVFPESGTWRCFGACNEGGDIFRFVMKKEGVDFSEALRRLAARAGVELHQRTAEESQTEERYTRLRGLLDLAVTYFRNVLVSSTAGEAVRMYLHGRGLADGTLESFQIGLAPEGWDAGQSFFHGKGFTDEELLEAGLLSQNTSGGYRDRFRNRIMIPIRDGSGRMCGFGARIVSPQDQPKFINSAQSPLFEKGRLLFGLDRASRAIRTTGEAVVVEGYFDAVAAHQAGFENVVSPMGTAITEAQLRLLKRHTQRVIMALDPDTAGESATLRGLELARDAFDREGEAAFNARGLLRFESRLRADLRVAQLPPGKDPDEVVLANPEDWKRRIAEAQPVVLHVLRVLTEGHDLNDPKIKADIAARINPLIEDVADRVERDAYRQQVARTLRIDERSLAGQVARPQARRTKQRPAETRSAPPSGALSREAYDIGLLMARPEVVLTLDRIFGEIGLPRIGPDDFSDSAMAAILNLVRQSAMQVEEEPEDYLRHHLSEDVAGAAEEAREAFRQKQGDRPPSVDEALEGVLRRRKHGLDHQMNDIRYYLVEVEQPLPGSDLAGIPAARKEALERTQAIHQAMLIVDRALADRFRLASVS
jgi:DNA primase